MIMASSQVETYQHEHNGHEENQSHKQRERRKSLLHKFAAAIFFDGENETGLTQSVPDPKEGTKNPDSEDAKSQMCLEVQQLDRERKKSLLMRFFDGLLARLDQEEEEQPKFTVDIDDEVSLGSECERKPSPIFQLCSLSVPLFQVQSATDSTGRLEAKTSSNDAVSNYVRYVFAMARGILTLVGSLLVLLYQPSNVSYKRKGPQDVEAQAVQSLSNVQFPGCPSENEATSNVSLEANQRSSLATVYSCSEDTKL
ncbi:hypothetical protein AWC38_SpisGene21060 [Stylophora pistillata]|uniref:Uncharacterized protein n=1 Tax=Stylophora pistillata TaxID=50429 RepID=A0A2B4R8U2_STYPI|nr:hypothetical protein AWC38_SpisGene21060 [Stylophora pistillata]